MWAKDLYDESYRSNTNGVTFHYCKHTQIKRLTKWADLYLIKLGVKPTTKVVIVGCGFGWSVELLRAKGINCIGVDSSAYIQANKHLTDLNELITNVTMAGKDPIDPRWIDFLSKYSNSPRSHAPIVYTDFSNDKGYKDVIALLGGIPDLFITEDCISTFSDTDLVFLQTAILGYKARTIHLITCDPTVNIKGITTGSLAYWRKVTKQRVIDVKTFNEDF